MSRPRWFGINAPFFGGLQKVFSRQTDERLIKNDLLQLLLTVPGERVMRPDFGTDIRNTLFENIIPEELDNLRSNIIERIAQFDSRVNISDVLIEGDTGGDNSIAIKVFGSFQPELFEERRGIEEFANLLIELNIPVRNIVSS